MHVTNSRSFKHSSLENHISLKTLHKMLYFSGLACFIVLMFPYIYVYMKILVMNCCNLQRDVPKDFLKICHLDVFPLRFNSHIHRGITALKMV